MLESAEHATLRGAEILAELLGYANNTDAYNPVSPNPDSKGAAACMKIALQNAGLQADEVNYINAHGTATPMGGRCGGQCHPPGVWGAARLCQLHKGATGHMMAPAALRK